ncbi:MAG: SRPBCC family protein [Pirellulaceae bacterium]|nr:SRPBCC family protein [Pirellulaceae bacterium]
MTTFAASRNLRARPDEVFDTVAHIDQLAQALPHVIRYEFLTEQTRGVGTRFRDVRQMGKREQPTDLEITEYVPCERVRLISVAGGTLWDTVFQVKPVGDATQLDLTMDAIAKNPLAWLMNALIKGMIQKALEKDMDYIQEYCNAKSR